MEEKKVDLKGEKPYAETGELTRVCRACKTRIPVSMKHCSNCGLRQFLVIKE